MLRVAHVACTKEHFFPIFFHFGLYEVKGQLCASKIYGTHPMCQKN